MPLRAGYLYVRPHIHAGLWWLCTGYGWPRMHAISDQDGAMNKMLQRLDQTDWTFDPKGLFDHVRNYGIAGGIALGASLFNDRFPFNSQVLYLLLFIAATLALLNAASGVTLIFRSLKRWHFPLATRILATVVYCLGTFAVCVALLEAAVQK